MSKSLYRREVIELPFDGSEESIADVTTWLEEQKVQYTIVGFEPKDYNLGVIIIWTSGVTLMLTPGHHLVMDRETNKFYIWRDEDLAPYKFYGTEQVDWRVPILDP